MTRKRKFELFASVDSLEAAKQTAYQGRAAAILVAVITTAFILISIALGGSLGATMPQVDAWAFWDVGLFVAIAIGIHKLSRVAAVAGLLLYIVEQIAMRAANPSMSGAGVVVAVFLILAFVNGVRGTFAYHRLRRLVAEQGQSDRPA